jgi:tripeptide aminopeptidase
VAAALSHVERNREQILAEWRTISEIPAPSGDEAARASYVERKLLEYGGVEVRRDAAGNLIALRRGTRGGAIVFDAHLDTVFPPEVDHATRIEHGRLFGPGVGDNSRNIAALLAMIRALDAAQLETGRDLLFLFSVEEETSFRGVRQFLADHRHAIDGFVALDGGYGGFTYGGVGTYWLQFHFSGPGGHTRSPSPPWSAALPVARSVERIYRLALPPQSWLNVAMLSAGDRYNVKAPEASFSVDLRSTDQEFLDALEEAVTRIADEEARRAGFSLRVETESRENVATLPGHRSSRMVLAAEAVWREFGFDPWLSNAASNHSSAALREGVPAISTGTAPCSDPHAVTESCEIDPFFTGIRRNIALAVALAE